MGKYIEPDGQLTSAEESGDEAIDSRMVASDKKINGQKEFRDNSQRISSKDSGFSETLDSIIEGDDEVFVTQTVESRPQSGLDNENSKSAATSTSSFSDDTRFGSYSELRSTSSDDLFAAVEIEDLELDMMEAVDQPPLAKAPLATFDDELEAFSDDNLQSQDSSQVKSSPTSCSEEMSEEEKIQRQLVQIFAFRAALSEGEPKRFREVNPFKNGEINPEFVLRAVTDEQSFVRLSDPYNLIRDANMDFEQVPEVMKLALGEERFQTLRGEAQRDAIWPVVAKGFWQFLDDCESSEKKVQLMPEFKACEQSFPLALTRAVAKFNLEFGLAEKEFQKYYLNSTLTDEERAEVHRILQSVNNLQAQFSELYNLCGHLPDAVVTSILGEVVLGDEGDKKSKKVAGIQKGIIKLFKVVKRKEEEMLKKDPLALYKKLLLQIVRSVKLEKSVTNPNGEVIPSAYQALVSDCQRDNFRSFYQQILNDLYSQMDPLLGEISLDGLHQIYDTTFDCIWQEIESDLPINNRSNGRGQSFRFKSRKHKAEKEKQKMREMAQAEFSILAATMATEIAYKQVNKQNQLRRLGGG